MFRSSPHTRSSGLRALLISFLIFWLVLNAFGPGASAGFQDADATAPFAGIRDLIYRQKYNEAIIQLEQLLEKNPRNGEALTYLATANLYQGLAFTKAQKDFKDALQAGGGATFFVTHSHEKFSTADVVDYCRGWLNFRAGGVEFIPIDGAHGFKLKYNEVEEFKINRLSKKVFHIKAGEKNQNFRGRPNSDLEPLLIVALYQSFARN
jgi:tetratricopeptide (TPR) repeat protein